MRLEGVKHVEIDSDGHVSSLAISFVSGARVRVPLTEKVSTTLVRMSLVQRADRSLYVVKNLRGRYVARDENGYHTTGQLVSALRLPTSEAADVLIAQVEAEWPNIRGHLRPSRLYRRLR
jgi:hypothetical protein